MKKVIALSIGLAFSAGAIAQEQVQAASTIEKTQSVVKDIVNFAKNNNAPVAKAVNVESKASETVVAEAKAPELKTEVKPETKTETKPVIEKTEVVKADKVKPVKIDKQEVKLPSVVKTEVKPAVEKTEVDPKECAQPVKAESVKPAPQKKKVIKAKKKVKIVKPVEKPVEVKAVVPTVDNAALLQADYYYVPKHATLEQYPLFAKPISYDDVEVKIENNNQNDVRVSLIDKRLGTPLDLFYLASPKINVLNITTDLVHKEPVELKYDESDAYDISFDNNQGCRVVFVEYQLNNQEKEKSVAKYIDARGEFVDQLPPSCKANASETKDTTFHTKEGNIVNIGYAQKQTSEKGLNMQVHFTREGHEFTPNNLVAYAVAKDFSTFYTLNAKTNAKGPYFGMDVGKKVSPGSYFVFIGYEQGNKTEWVKTNISVQ